MNAPLRPAQLSPEPAGLARAAAIEAACRQACSRVAPTWPLDQAIAVNPHWARVERPLREVAARLAVLGHMQVFPPRERVKAAWQSGRILAADLAQALARLAADGDPRPTPDQALAALAQAPDLPRLPLLIDVLDEDPEGRHRLPWRQAITHQVSQVCAAYFDVHQADWQPERHGGLYHFWRETLTHDHGIGVMMGLPHIGHALSELPANREAAEHWVLQRLGLPPERWADYLEAVLLSVHGWAAWCAYLGWQARLAGQADDHLRDLLAIRLAWGAILLASRNDAATRQALVTVQARWAQAPACLSQAEAALQVDELWQLAQDIAYQRSLASRLASAARAEGEPAGTPEVQAAFCIDVRSEPMRRAIESVWPGVQTLGFAGFFGLPLAYTPLGTAARRPQLPGLLPPRLEVTDEVRTGLGDDTPADGPRTADARAARQRGLARLAQWDAGSRWPGAAFSFVEAAGVASLGPLMRHLRPAARPRPTPDAAGLPARYRPLCRPSLPALPLAEQLDWAEGVLRGMGLVQVQAPLVLLVGHTSQSANNAQAAALDCGACCGQSGEVNARTLARLLNTQAVQQGLRARGLDLPAGCAFLAALHNTTTDEIEALDLDLADASTQGRWARLEPVLWQAADQVRRLRAPRLGLDPRTPHLRLLAHLRQRASDPAQTRPEWGLAGNAALILAPRHRSLGAVLDGRVFLHDYHAAQDPSGELLERLMTAPLLVAHWINWQYHASTCDPEHLGSGNKLLHNVVGGRIGVFEGNGGDLRIGLSRQSLHDGQHWVHEPVRLTVLIDAPAEAIDRVLARHAVVHHLQHNGWLHLWRFAEGGGFEGRGPLGWRPVPAPDAIPSV